MVYIFGNGGSAALASHFACDLGKGTANGSEKRFRVLALTDNVPLITAWANDANYADIFAEQLANLVRPGDVAFGISGSGNSSNVLRGLQVAKQAGATTVGLTGFGGGELKDQCDACVIVPSENMQIIEDLHLCVAHSLFTSIRRKICSTQSACA
jgi:D-sedoheptulose 7-phosphate isomerase